MINIYDICSGWATLQIGYCSFAASYLTNIKEELDYLFSFDDSSVNRITLEGEGHGDLNLVAYLTYGSLRPWSNIEEDKKMNNGEINCTGEILNIVWQRIFSNEDSSVSVLKFPYKKFKEEWVNLKKEIKDDYIINFLMPFGKEDKEEMYDEY